MSQKFSARPFCVTSLCLEPHTVGELQLQLCCFVYRELLCRICFYFLLLEIVAFSCIHRSVGLLIRTSFRCTCSVLRLPNTHKSNGTLAI